MENNMSKKLNGKNIIVTGANRGIGRSVVEKMAENGVNVWACSRKLDKSLQIKPVNVFL